MNESNDRPNDGAAPTLAPDAGPAESKEVVRSLLPPGIRAEAATLVSSGLFNQTTLTQAIVKIELGQALGINPAQAMSDIHIVEGRPFIGATLLAASVKRTGKYTYKVEKIDDEACEIAFYEREADEWREIGLSRFTIEDAERAGLVKDKSAWKKYPRNMLFARAVSNGFKWFAPDAIGSSFYALEEMGDIRGLEIGAPPAPPETPLEGDEVVDAEVVEPITEGQILAIHGAIELSTITGEELTLKLMEFGVSDVGQLNGAQADDLLAFVNEFPTVGAPDAQPAEEAGAA